MSTSLCHAAPMPSPHAPRTGTRPSPASPSTNTAATSSSPPPIAATSPSTAAEQTRLPFAPKPSPTMWRTQAPAQVSNGVSIGCLRVRLNTPQHSDGLRNLSLTAVGLMRPVLPVSLPVSDGGQEVVGGQHGSNVSGQVPARAVSTALSRRKLLLAGLWLTAAAAEWAALRPVIYQEHVRPEVVLYHVVGGSFAACGLLAWHRRPESRAGPLMVATGLLFFVHGTLGRLHSSFAETIGIAVSNWWIITFAALLVWFPGGRRRWAPSEKFIIGAFVIAEVVLTLVWMLFAEIPRNLALVWPNPHTASTIDKTISSLGFAASVCLAVLLAARWLKGTRPVRRASAPAAAGAITLLFLGGLILQGVFTADAVALSRLADTRGSGAGSGRVSRRCVADVGGASRGWRPVRRSWLDGRPTAAGRVGESARGSDTDPGLLASAVRLLHRQRRPEARASPRR